MAMEMKKLFGEECQIWASVVASFLFDLPRVPAGPPLPAAVRVSSSVQLLIYVGQKRGNSKTKVFVRTISRCRPRPTLLGWYPTIASP
ncbi:hypothetical protein SCA6_017072 [Theobroma cacao]